MREMIQHEWSAQYKSFISIIKTDYPYQLPENSFDGEVEDIFRCVYVDIISQHSKIREPYYSRNGLGFINLAYVDHYLILCHRFSHAIYLNGNGCEIADAVYYSCRIRTATDVFYRAEIGDFFMPCHSLGAVLDSKATYGIGFQLYNGAHIGPYGIGSDDSSEWVHPVIGDGVIMYANSQVYGETIIGNNVTISPRTSVIDETIPDNCVVFGASPNLRAVPNKHNNLMFFDI